VDVKTKGLRGLPLDKEFACCFCSFLRKEHSESLRYRSHVKSLSRQEIKRNKILAEVDDNNWKEI